MTAPDLRTTVGTVELPNPILTASGTSGHGAELEAYFPLADLGAVTVKSLSAAPWDGNTAPRVHQATAGMLNSVGLQGPGVSAWLREDLPELQRAGARVVASIWGRTVEGYAAAARALGRHPAGVVAVEVNLSCPNLDGGAHLFAQSTVDTHDAIAAVVTELDLPVWAKLSAQVANLVEIASAAVGGGAEAVTLINTIMGMAIDVDDRRYRLGSGPGGGGLSGPAIHPIAVRAVHDVHGALPGVPIVGVGGVATGDDAIELLLAGASAVQVGTATFADPRAPRRVLAEVGRWCAGQGVGAIDELIGAVHA